LAEFSPERLPLSPSHVQEIADCGVDIQGNLLRKLAEQTITQKEFCVSSRHRLPQLCRRPRTHHSSDSSQAFSPLSRELRAFSREVRSGFDCP